MVGVLFWVGGSGWENILVGWEWMGVYHALFWVGGVWWENMSGRWGWVRKYFGLVMVIGGKWDIILGGWGWVGVGGGDWGRVGLSALFDNAHFKPSITFFKKDLGRGDIKKIGNRLISIFSTRFERTFCC